MNNLLKTGLAFCFAIFTLSTSLHAQIFNVTTNNTGATLYKVTGSTLTPLSGSFSSGDIIVMKWFSNTYPNPADGSTDIEVTATPTGTSPTSFAWVPKGDIGSVAGSLVNTGTTSTNGFNTINENNRGTSAFDVGQSKGRVYFNWSTGSCGNQQAYFDIYKSFAATNINAPNSTTPPTPPIIGPNCILPSHTYTYSVDPIMSDNLSDEIGLDRYFWDISAISGATGVYWSTDSSSITFTTSATALTSSVDIKCYYGVGNTATWGTNTAYAVKTVSPAAGVPVVTVTGTAPTSSFTASTTGTNCLPTYLTGTHTLILSVTPQPGATYQWGFGTNGGSLANGWNTSPATTGPLPFTTTGSSLTINDVLNQPGVVTLTVTDACNDPTTYTYSFGRQLAQADSALIIGTNVCVNPGSPLTPVTVVPSANQNNVTWSNSNFTFSGGGSPYTIVPLNTLATGRYTVTATFGCSQSATYNINVVSATAPTISVVGGGNSCGTSGTTIGFSANPAPAGARYTWTLGGTGVGYSCALCGTNTTNSTVSVTIGSSGSATLTLRESVDGATNCMTPVSATTAIGITPTSLTVTPTCHILTQASTIALTCTNLGTGTYTWSSSSSPTAGTLTSLSTSTPANSFVTTNPVTFTTVTYTVTASLATGCTVTGTGTANLTSTAPYSINASYCIDPDCVPSYGNLQLSSISLGTSFSWINCTTNGLLIPGTLNNPSLNPTTTNNWNFSHDSTGHTTSYGAQFTQTGGCVYRLCADITDFTNAVNNRHQNPNGINASNSTLLPNFKVYPNPNSGTFKVDMNNTSENGTITVYDISGKKIIEKKLAPGTNNFDFKLPAGAYNLQMTADGKQQTEKIVIVE